MKIPISDFALLDLDAPTVPANAAGIENEVRAAVGRLIVASNERLVEEGDLSAVRWFEQQVSGKSAAELVAAFAE